MKTPPSAVSLRPFLPTLVGGHCTLLVTPRGPKQPYPPHEDQPPNQNIPNNRVTYKIPQLATKLHTPAGQRHDDECTSNPPRHSLSRKLNKKTTTQKNPRFIKSNTRESKPPQHSAATTKKQNERRPLRGKPVGRIQVQGAQQHPGDGLRPPGDCKQLEEQAERRAELFGDEPYQVLLGRRGREREGGCLLAALLARRCFAAAALWLDGTPMRRLIKILREGGGGDRDGRSKRRVRVTKKGSEQRPLLEHDRCSSSYYIPTFEVRGTTQHWVRFALGPVGRRNREGETSAIHVRPRNPYLNYARMRRPCCGRPAATTKATSLKHTC